MTGEMAESALFVIAGTEYAFGLEWVSASRNASTSAHLKRQALRLRASHLAWRPKVHQVGIARVLQPGARLNWSRWRAAAAAFADMPQPPAEPHTMIGAFSFLSGEVWVVAASQSRIFADGDRFFSDPVAAREHFRRLYDRVPRWGVVFAPADWGIPRANSEGPLAFLTGRRPRRAAAEPIYRILDAIGLSSRPGVALCRLGGGTLTESAQSYKVAACVVAIGIFFAVQQLPSRPGKPPSAPPKQQIIEPWFPLIEDAAARIEICVSGILQSLGGGIVPGWDASEFSCDVNSVTVALVARRFTPLSTLAGFQPGALVQGSARTATISRPMAGGPSPRVPITPPLSTADEVLDSFGRLDERLRAINAFSNPIAPVDVPPLEMGVPRPRPYRTMNWSLQTQAPPQLWRRDIASLRDIEITSVGLKRADGAFVWIVKGIAYVAP